MSQARQEFKGKAPCIISGRRRKEVKKKGKEREKKKRGRYISYSWFHFMWNLWWGRETVDTCMNLRTVSERQKVEQGKGDTRVRNGVMNKWGRRRWIETKKTKWWNMDFSKMLPLLHVGIAHVLSAAVQLLVMNWLWSDRHSAWIHRYGSNPEPKTNRQKSFCYHHSIFLNGLKLSALPTLKKTS